MDLKLLPSQSHAQEERRALSIHELASQWGVHANTIRKLIKSGALKSFRAGTRVLIDQSTIQAFENSATTEIAQ